MNNVGGVIDVGQNTFQFAIHKGSQKYSFFISNTLCCNVEEYILCQPTPDPHEQAAQREEKRQNTDDVQPEAFCAQPGIVQKRVGV